jgi:hypothetical protein
LGGGDWKDHSSRAARAKSKTPSQPTGWDDSVPIIPATLKV